MNTDTRAEKYSDHLRQVRRSFYLYGPDWKVTVFTPEANVNALYGLTKALFQQSAKPMNCNWNHAEHNVRPLAGGELSIFGVNTRNADMDFGRFVGRNYTRILFVNFPFLPANYVGASVLLNSTAVPSDQLGVFVCNT